MQSQKNGDSKFTRDQFSQFQEVQQIVQTGDIIISSTNSLSYQAMRTLLKVHYDHLSVFLDKENVIHISWPRVRIIHPLNLLQRVRDFKILRPSFKNANERLVFLNILKSSINAHYDLKQLFKGVKNKLKINLSYQKQVQEDWIDSGKDIQLSKTQVCTDLIFYALSVGSPSFRTLLQEQIKFLDYRLVGSFSTDDLNVIVSKTTFFEIILEKQQLNEQPYLFDSITQQVLAIAQTTNINLDSIMKSIQQPIWNSIIKLDLNGLLQLRNKAQNILVIYGLYSFFGLSTYEKAKGFLFMYLFKKMPNKVKTDFSQIAFHLSELSSLIKNEEKNLRNLRKIAFHFFMLLTIGMLKASDNILPIGIKNRRLFQVAQNLLDFRGPKL